MYLGDPFYGFPFITYFEMEFHSTYQEINHLNTKENDLMALVQIFMNRNILKLCNIGLRDLLSHKSHTLVQLNLWYSYLSCGEPLFRNVICTIHPYRASTHWPFKIKASPCKGLDTPVHGKERNLNFSRLLCTWSWHIFYFA